MYIFLYIHNIKTIVTLTLICFAAMLISDSRLQENLTISHYLSLVFYNVHFHHCNWMIL